MQHLYRRIYADPEFHELELKRGRFSWLLASIHVDCLLQFHFNYRVCAGTVFGYPHHRGSVSLPGVSQWHCVVILLSFLLTGIYVFRANTEFDRLVDDVIVEHAQKTDKATVGD